MARFDKSSTKRPKQDAAVAATRSAKRSTAPSIEDTMFFPRLRRHAKWMFVFLAVALGGGFVLFGVGAGGTGVGDILRGGGASSGVPSISSSEKKTEKDPKNVQAWTDLSTALQADGQTDKAIDAQKHVVVLTPKDSDALRDARRPLSRSGDDEAAGGPARAAPHRLPGRRPGLPGRARRRRRASRSSTTGSASSSTRRARRRSRSSSARRRRHRPDAVTAYKEIVKLTPNDPNIQLELAQAAQQAGDTAVRDRGLHRPSSSSLRTTRMRRS